MTEQNTDYERRLARLLASARTDEKRQRIDEAKRTHRRTLNKFEPHLGCVVCRGRLVEGVCETCDPAHNDGSGATGSFGMSAKGSGGASDSAPAQNDPGAQS